jgi:hypothetical protein
MVDQVPKSNCFLPTRGPLPTRTTRRPLSTHIPIWTVLKLFLVRHARASTRLLPLDTLTLTRTTFLEAGDNFYWRGYPSLIGKWGLCIDCKADGTDPGDLEIIVSGLTQVEPNTPSVRHLLLFGIHWAPRCA